MCQEHWKERREIGVTIEKVGKRSCLDATELEKNLCRWNSSAANKEGVVDFKASYDMGWQRKSTGKAYNSSSGMLFWYGQKEKRSWVMGHELVIASSVRSIK